jgi:hypothetical protein
MDGNLGDVPGASQRSPPSGSAGTGTRAPGLPVARPLAHHARGTGARDPGARGPAHAAPAHPACRRRAGDRVTNPSELMTAPAQFPAETSADGAFVRQRYAFRDRFTADGRSGFPAEAGRYHLYVSLACPWAHRAIIVRGLLGLEDVISMGVVDPVRDERGWALRRGAGHGPDPVCASSS